MSMQDPISDMFTRIRNAQQRAKSEVTMPSSTKKHAIARVLQDEGYVGDVSVSEGVKPELTIALKYSGGEPVIEFINRVSRPSLRVYRKYDALPKVKGGLGISIISTSKGVMTDRAARKAQLGGEVIGEVL